jgi:hypothetical protein
MSRQDMFGAFVLNRAIDVPEYGFDQDRVEWAGERLGRAGLSLRVTEPRSPAEALDGLPHLSTTWLGVPAEVRVIDSEDFRALVVIVSQMEVYRNVVRDGEAYARRAAGEFRDLCDATNPTYAFFHNLHEGNIPEYLENVSAELLGLYLPALASFGYPLWYVDKAWAGDLPPGAVPLGDELPARHGMLVLGRDSLAEWL